MISSNVKIAQTFWDKIKGLLGKTSPICLIIKTRFGIHTFGMKFPIDVIVLSNTNKVIKTKKHLEPNRIFVWNIKYSTVIELPSGTINHTNTKIGDIIEIK